MPTITRSRRLKSYYVSSPTKLPAITWQEFRTRYFDECAIFMKDSTQAKVAGVFDSIELLAKPALLRDMDAPRISRWQACRKRDFKVSDATIKGNLAVLQAALKWAVEQEMLPACPKIRMPQRAKNQSLSKGRPVTEAEFQAMLDKCNNPEVRRFVEFLWWSGLRLSEALDLSWEPQPDAMSLDLSAEASENPRDSATARWNLKSAFQAAWRFLVNLFSFQIRRRTILCHEAAQLPMYRIPADAEKGNTNRLCPVAPEAAKMLAEVPHSERTGRVFRLPFRNLEEASRGITALGKASSIVVKQAPLKYASAHDLRRSFGERWSQRVMPQVLMELMRHESIETTMRFYVGRNAQRTARSVWDAVK